jgi:protein-tyrosine phosphatase
MWSINTSNTYRRNMLSSALDYTKSTSLYKYARNRITLSLSIARHLHDPNGFRWWDEVSTGVYLGAVPLRLFNHAQELKNLGIKHVLSIYEPFEMDYTNETWTDYGIQLHHIECEDYATLSPDMFNQAVGIINDAYHAQQPIYVHCKGGVGRSAMAVLAWMMLNLHDYQTLTTTEAVHRLKQIRPQINPNYTQECGLNNYVTAHRYLNLHPLCQSLGDL